MSKTIRVYGAGGAGTNIATHFIGHQSKTLNAAIAPAVLDTSEANLRGRDIKDIDTHLIEGLDGSGKIRSENYDQIRRCIKQMLVDIPPEDFNVVVFSGSGGSGSVIGPLLIKELQERDIPVIGVVIGSYESMISAVNTKKTLQSLESIAEKTDKPTVICYQGNEPNTPRSEVDAGIHTLIGAISILASGNVREMDTRDIYNWVYFNKISGRAQLAILRLAYDENTASNVKLPISVASLYNDPDQQHQLFDTDYHTVGYTDLRTAANVEELHFFISTYDLAKIYSDIREVTDNLEQARQARVERDSIVTDDRNDDGMVV